MVDSWRRASASASTEPSTSPLRMILSSLKVPRASLLPISSRVMCFWVLKFCSRRICCLWMARVRASLSADITIKLSPAWGAPLSPSICTGMAGPAVGRVWPWWLDMAFTLP